MPIETAFMSRSPAQNERPHARRGAPPHQLVDAAVLPHQVVAGHFGGRIAQAGERRLAGRHAGVVQHERVDGSAARRPKFGEGSVRETSGLSGVNTRRYARHYRPP